MGFFGKKCGNQGGFHCKNREIRVGKRGYAQMVFTKSPHFSHLSPPPPTLAYSGVLLYTPYRLTLINNPQCALAGYLYMRILCMCSSGVLVYSLIYTICKYSTMLITLELTDSNSTSVLDYVQALGLWNRLYINDPYYSLCIVRCDSSRALWLGLLC